MPWLPGIVLTIGNITVVGIWVQGGGRVEEYGSGLIFMVDETPGGVEGAGIGALRMYRNMIKCSLIFVSLTSFENECAWHEELVIVH